MSELVRWTGGLRPMNVSITRKEGLDLLSGEWEAKTSGGTKVIVRESEVEPVAGIVAAVSSLLGGAA